MAFENPEDDVAKLKVSGAAQQGSYIYRPAKRGVRQGPRPPKRRKLGGTAGDESENLPFVPLLEGHEDESAVKLRYRTFQNFWMEQQEKIQTILHDVHSDALTNIVSFIENASSEQCNGRIPTGILSLGSNISSLGRFFTRLQEELHTDRRVLVVVLDSGDASNLKTLLKSVIRAAVSFLDGDEGYQNLISDRAGPKLHPYDLDLLYEYTERNAIEKVVVAFKNSEAFDQRLLSDLISLLGSWLDRIQFTLLFGVITSADLFEGRLPRLTVRWLQGQLFEVQDSENSIDRIYASLQNHEDAVLWLGHGVSKAITLSSKDRFQSPERFTASMKYSHMAHFFANPLSVLLSDNVPLDVIQQPSFCEAIRNLPSFRRHADDLLEEGNTVAVRKLLDDDKHLAHEAKSHVRLGQEMMKSVLRAVECIAAILKLLNSFKCVNRTSLTIQALQGELLESKIIEDMLSTIKKTPSDSFKALVHVLPANVTETEELLHGFDNLLRKQKGSNALRTEYDDHHTTHKTAVVGQRVKLTKGKAKLSKGDIEYTATVDRLRTVLVQYLSKALIRPESLFMHEAFLNDHRVPMRDTFTPRARFAIERGLSNPQDYLGNGSGDNDDMGILSAAQPAISVLYQLYMESGAFVNIHDLWRAFYTVMGGEDGESCDERIAFAIFYRVLSELKMMGLIKQTKKKPDHLAKSTWMGL